MQARPEHESARRLVSRLLNNKPYKESCMVQCFRKLAPKVVVRHPSKFLDFGSHPEIHKAADPIHHDGDSTMVPPTSTPVVAGAAATPSRGESATCMLRDAARSRIVGE
ncbi:hypothetical protein EJB05_17574, partial [Eragrostis curvula]